MKTLLLTMMVAASLKTNISFTPTWTRYPSPDTILSTMQWQFPNADLNRISSQCVYDTTDTHTTLGGNIAVTGEPAIANPNSGFIVWYMGCVSEYVSADQNGFSDLYKKTPDAKTVAAYIGDKTAALCAITYDPNQPYHTKKCDWSTLDKKARLAAITEQIERLVGPDDVIKDSGVAKSIGDFAVRIDDALLSVWAKNPNAFGFLQIRKDAGPLDTVRAIRYLVLMADTLKY